MLSILCILGVQHVISQIGIGTISPDPSSILDVSSTNKGVLYPKMYSAQRDGISNPAKGLILYNISEDCLQINSGTPSNPDWKCIGANSTNTATVINNCNANGFEGAYVNGNPLASNTKFTINITNNSFK